MRRWFVVLPVQCLSDTLPGLFQRFWQHAAFGHRGHEIGVADPAREDVHVAVAGDSGSGGAAEVHTKIDSVGRVNVPQYAFHFL